MKRKGYKSILLLAIFILSLSMNFPVYATIQECNNLEKNDYYEEKGEISLIDLSLSMDDDSEIVITGEDKINKEKLLFEISNSKNLNNYLKSSIEEENLPIAIGYTRVFLKSVEDEGGDVHLEPMTIKDVEKNKATLQKNDKSTRLGETYEGDESSDGNLTLYTTATPTKSGITVKSIAEWGTGFQISQKYTPASYRDYISASTNTKYVLTSDSFKGIMTNGESLAKKFYSRKDEGTASVVYSFNEMVENVYSVKKATVTLNCGKNGTLPDNVRSTSRYVHTWGSGAVQISIGTGGVSFDLEGVPKSWQISSGVTVPTK